MMPLLPVPIQLKEEKGWSLSMEDELSYSFSLFTDPGSIPIKGTVTLGTVIWKPGNVRNSSAKGMLSQFVLAVPIPAATVGHQILSWMPS
jgi:hypothetical protein